MKVTVHTLVKNEDIWIEYALQSVLPFAEKIFVYDTGSTDKTVEIIKSIKSPKIILEERGSMDRKGLVTLRQEMIEKTKTEWFLILDGDEIWPKDQLEKLLKLADKSDDKIGIVNFTRNSIGDVYHYLPELAGKYQIGNCIGNITIRLIKKTKSMQIAGEYPFEAYQHNNIPIQDQTAKLIFSDIWYLHTSNLQRSSQVSNKMSGSFGKNRYPERGLKINNKDLPEVLKFPTINQDIALKKRSLDYEIMAIIINPLLQLKRKLKK